jgi:hypothetical protein
MGKLRMDGPNDSKYVRGYLLNDNLGGLGTPNNLFPITATANGLHERSIESTVKDWVNVQNKWAVYTVSIVPRGYDLSHDNRTENWVDADIVARLTYMRPNAGVLEAAESVPVPTIESRHPRGGATSRAIDAAGNETTERVRGPAEPIEQREEDRDTVPLESTRRRATAASGLAPEVRGAFRAAERVRSAAYLASTLTALERARHRRG